MTDHVMKISYTTSDALDPRFIETDFSENISSEKTTIQQNAELTKKALTSYVTKAKEQIVDYARDTKIDPSTSIARPVNEKAFKKTHLIIIIVCIISLVILALFLSKLYFANQSITKKGE